MQGTECLAGKVIAVTGAGRGIGRAIALLAAREGARIVVNDLGAAPNGAGSDAGPAHDVVAEIRASGGEAVANTASVADPQEAAMIVETALDHFGRIDCVVNNAGILRDRMFHKMRLEDFEDVVRVHLMGSFHVSRAAATHFREQESGTYIHLTSTSGLIGNSGQSNYAAAKLGLVGLSKGIALDMARFNVRSNCIAPFAWSRLIGTIPTTTEAEAKRVERIKAMGPEKIAPLAVFLASDAASTINGQVFVARMNEIFLMGQSRPLRGLHRSEGWSQASLAGDLLNAMKADFYPLDRSSDIFCWDPI